MKRIAPFFWFLIFFAIPSSSCLAIDNPPPIRIGATVSLEGRYKEPSFMIRSAFRLWEREINKKGGLLGRKVELILYNDKSREDLAGLLYEKLIQQDKVDLVFSPYGTPLTLAASIDSEAHKLVMLACGASGEMIWNRGYRYVFGVYAPARRYFIGLLDLMARRGHGSLSMVYDQTSPFNLDVVEGARKWARRFHLKIVFEKGYANGKTGGIAALVPRIMEANASGLLLSAYPPDCYRLLEVLDQHRYRPAVLGMTIAPVHPQFGKKAGKSAEKVFAPSQWEADERIPFPGTKRFIAAFRAFTGQIPSYHAGSAYAACQLYEQAVLSTESLDNDKIRDYIATLDTVTVIGRFKVDSSGKQIGHNPIIIQWQNGKKEIVWPSKMQTAKPLF